MRHYLLLLVLVLMSCKGETKEIKATDVLGNSPIKAPEDSSLEVYNFNEIERFLNTTDDKTVVVNFWATWCAPCIKELPYFEKINTTYADKVSVLLVSLDFPNKYESSLKPFIKRHNLQSRVLVLNDPDANTWIPKVAEDWSGAIPATLIFNKNKRRFYEQAFTYEELVTEVEQFLN